MDTEKVIFEDFIDLDKEVTKCCGAKYTVGYGGCEEHGYEDYDIYQCCKCNRQELFYFEELSYR